jgi:hypothetical protein
MISAIPGKPKPRLLGRRRPGTAVPLEHETTGTLTW